MINKNSQIVAIVGPTAAGKSDVGFEIAQDIFEIISVDSAQVYKYMDIGTNKVPVLMRSLITHYCIDIVNPDYWFTAGDFCKYAKDAVETIYNKGKIPLFVGGTGLYFHSFFYGLADMPEIKNEIKKDLKIELEKNGLDYMYETLKKVDPDWANRLHPNDKQRILRGLEVYRQTGIPISQYIKKQAVEKKYNVLFIGITLDRDDLKNSISKRVDEMILRGLVDEVKKLREMGFGPQYNSQKAIGYAEIHQYLDNQIELNQAIEKIKHNTWKYAKRQKTWFKRYNPEWYKKNEIDKIKSEIFKWLKLI